MWYLPLILLIIVLVIVNFVSKKGDWIVACIIPVVLSLLISSVLVCGDYYGKTLDYETWSGMVIDWEHDEEYDVYHPAQYDKDGRMTSSAWTEHFNATNHIRTTDEGWITVYYTPNGRKMNDSYPNHTEELQEMWTYGTPTASRHSFQNKVQASYSIYKHQEINLDEYTDLPEYPSEVQDFIYIDRILGNVPNKNKALLNLAKWNTHMNKMIDDPEKEGKKRSWKQVNLIFANVGDNKPMEYGFALQDYWENGGKNDYIVSFSMGSDGKVDWVYPFSWSECESLNLEIKDYILGLETIKDFNPVVDNVSQLVIDKFERKPFAEFDYIQIEVSGWVIVSCWFINIGIFIGVLYMMNGNYISYIRYRPRRRF